MIINKGGGLYMSILTDNQYTKNGVKFKFDNNICKGINVNDLFKFDENNNLIEVNFDGVTIEKIKKPKSN